MQRRVFFQEHIPLVWFKPRIDVDFIAFHPPPPQPMVQAIYPARSPHGRRAAVMLVMFANPMCWDRSPHGPMVFGVCLKMLAKPLNPMVHDHYPY